MKVSQDYAGSFITATWLVEFLKEHGLNELTATIASVRQHKFNNGETKYVLALVGKTMEVTVNKTNALILAKDLGDDTAGWPGSRLVMSTSWGNVLNGSGNIMHMRGVPPAQKTSPNVVPPLQPMQGNSSSNGYAAASQPAADRPAQPQSNISAELNDEIPF